jgi:hypothetical protein
MLRVFDGKRGSPTSQQYVDGDIPGDVRVLIAESADPREAVTTLLRIAAWISAYMPDSDQREKMMPFVGKYVQATGPVFTRNGTHAIAITQIKELKSVHVDTDAR